ncbi:MAG: DUF2252 family protein [Salinisphaera sp.]|jgi:uncharacterized protein (DUF2252 family)|nr:DUF2252 family protein [Salinisphaera sp.]
MPFYFKRPSRRETVLKAVDAHNRGLSQADRRRKYTKMASSPYRFYRGTNHLFWGDVWNDWRYQLFGGLNDTQTWLQGDAHAYNHGAYGDDRQGVHYGMDDFDDAVIGDYQYDLWRHATSMVLDAEENVELSPDQTRRAIRHYLTSYLDTLTEHLNTADTQDIHVDYDRKPLGPFIDKVIDKRGVERQLKKWTTLDADGNRLFNTDYKKLGKVSAKQRKAIVAALTEQYPATLQADGLTGERGHFSIKDIARRLNAGTGSLGLDRFYALIREERNELDNDVILDIKEQTPPPAYAHMTSAERRQWRQSFEHEAHRHALAFRALAHHPDEYVGWLSLDNKHFSVRRRSPYKKDFPTHKIDGFKAYRRLTRAWGRILAREHMGAARALRPNDPGYFNRAVIDRCSPNREAFKAMVVDVAFNYAHCVRRDHAYFVAEHAPAAEE